MVSQIIAQPDLSSPPNTVVPSVRMMLPSTIGLTPSPGATVSICAQISSGATPATVPSILAIRLPTSPLTRSPALSKRQTAPSASISRLSRAAQAPSRRDRESIRTRSSSRFFIRSRLTGAIADSFWKAEVYRRRSRGFRLQPVRFQRNLWLRRPTRRRRRG